MPITQVDIANEALDLVGAATIVSLNDPTPEAGIVARAIGPTTSRVLRSYPFACVTRTQTLSGGSAGTNDGESDGEIQFELPSDCLRVVTAQASAWRIESTASGRVLVAQDVEVTQTSTQDDSSGDHSMTVTYVVDEADPDRLDPLVRDLVVHELAIKIAAKLTESPQRIAALTRKAIQVRKLAQATDAREGTPPSLDNGSQAGTWVDQFGAGW